MVKGSDGKNYPDHLNYTCMYCFEDVDPANCWVDDSGLGIVLHLSCVKDFEELD